LLIFYLTGHVNNKIDSTEKKYTRKQKIFLILTNH